MCCLPMATERRLILARCCQEVNPALRRSHLQVALQSAGAGDSGQAGNEANERW